MNTIKKSTVILAALACAWTVLSSPTPASAADINWRIFASAIDTADLDEAFGAGLRASFPFKEKWEFDIGALYYDDFKNRFEDNSDQRIRVKVQTIPIDIGFTWNRNGDSGLQLGFGGTYGYMDINDIEIDGIDERITGDANDDFGVYVKIGYQGKKGFFGELMYRFLDVKVERLEIGGVPAPDVTIEMRGAAVNLGYRF